MNAEQTQLDLIERQAVGRMLAFQLARAIWHLSKVPVWRPIKRFQVRCFIAAIANMLRDIEQGRQHDRQATWMIDVEEGDFIDRSIAATMAVVDEERP